MAVIQYLFDLKGEYPTNPNQYLEQDLLDHVIICMLKSQFPLIHLMAFFKTQNQIEVNLQYLNKSEFNNISFNEQFLKFYPFELLIRHKETKQINHSKYIDTFKEKNKQSQLEYKVFSSFNVSSKVLLDLQEYRNRYRLFQILGIRSFLESSFNIKENELQNFITYTKQVNKEIFMNKPVLLPNPWGLILPILTISEKKRHFWIYSKSTNKGKSSIGNILISLFGQYSWKYQIGSDFQDNLSPFQSFIILDEFNGQIKLQTLQMMCDSIYQINVKNSRFTFNFDGWIIVLSNFHPCTVYGKTFSTLESRFFIIDVEKLIPIDQFKNQQQQLDTWMNVPSLKSFNIQLNNFPQLQCFADYYKAFFISFISCEYDNYKHNTQWEYNYFSNSSGKSNIMIEDKPLKDIKQQDINICDLSKLKKQLKQMINHTKLKPDFTQYWCPLFTQDYTKLFDETLFNILIEQYNLHITDNRIKYPEKLIQTMKQYRTYFFKDEQIKFDLIIQLMKSSNLWLLPFPLFVFPIKLIPIIWLLRSIFMQSMPFTISHLPQVYFPKTTFTAYFTSKTLSYQTIETLYLYKELLYNNLNRPFIFKRNCFIFLELCELLYDDNYSEEEIFQEEFLEEEISAIQSIVQKTDTQNIIQAALFKNRFAKKKEQLESQTDFEGYNTVIYDDSINKLQLAILTCLNQKKQEEEEEKIEKEPEKKIKTNDKYDLIFTPTIAEEVIQSNQKTKEEQSDQFDENELSNISE